MSPHEWLMAEVDELARNRARLCSLCRRRSRFWPTHPGTAVRAAGRGWSDRCESCVLAPIFVAAALENKRPDPADRRHVRQLQAEEVQQQINEIEQLPPGAECLDALTMLYLQLQLLADELHNEEQGLRVIAGGRVGNRWIQSSAYLGEAH